MKIKLSHLRQVIEEALLSEGSVKVRKVDSFEQAAKYSQGTRWPFGMSRQPEQARKVYDMFASKADMYFVVHRPENGPAKRYMGLVRSGGEPQWHDETDRAVGPEVFGEDYEQVKSAMGGGPSLGSVVPEGVQTLDQLRQVVKKIIVVG